MMRSGRGRKPKRLINSVDEGPLATSSPDTNKNDGQTKIECKLIFDQFNAVKRKTFEDFLDSVHPELLNLPCRADLKFYNMVDEAMKNGECEIKSNRPGCANWDLSHGAMDEDESSVFKVPLQKKGRKKELRNSKTVHWHINSDETDESQSNVFKTPSVKKGNHSRAQSFNSEFKTPNNSQKSAFIGTPGSAMPRNVRMVRQPHAGETAVSLAGSPLLVAPFGVNSDPQVTVSLPTDGRLMTILPPDRNEMINGDEGCSEVFSHLDSSTKERLKQLVRFISENVIK